MKFFILNFPFSMYYHVCNSLWPSKVSCYARVIQETCNSSAADINVLKVVVYNAKFLRVVEQSCAIGELLSVYCVGSRVLILVFKDISLLFYLLGVFLVLL